MSTPDKYYLIDPPVGPFSTPKEVEAWLKELAKLEQTTEVRDAIKEAKTLLKDAA